MTVPRASAPALPSRVPLQNQIFPAEGQDHAAVLPLKMALLTEGSRGQTTVWQQESRMVAVVGILTTLHNTGKASQEATPYQRIEQLLQDLSEDQRLDKDLDRHLSRMQVIEKRRSRDYTFSRVCAHNSLFPFNLRLGSGGVQLQDFSQMGQGDAFFDLATLSVFAHFSAADDKRLLRLYFGCCTPDLLQALQDMKFLTLLHEGLWGLCQGNLPGGLQWSEHLLHQLQQGHLHL